MCHSCHTTSHDDVSMMSRHKTGAYVQHSTTERHRSSFSSSKELYTISSCFCGAGQQSVGWWHQKRPQVMSYISPKSKFIFTKKNTTPHPSVGRKHVAAAVWTIDISICPTQIDPARLPKKKKSQNRHQPHLVDAVAAAMRADGIPLGGVAGGGQYGPSLLGVLFCPLKELVVGQPEEEEGEKKKWQKKQTEKKLFHVICHKYLRKTFYCSFKAAATKKSKKHFFF